MGNEPLFCKNCGAPFSQKAIDDGIPFGTSLIIRCEYCDASAAYIPSNTVHTVLDSSGLEKIAEELKLSRLDQLERDRKAELLRIEQEQREKDERIFAELRAIEWTALQNYEVGVASRRNELRNRPMR